MNRLFPEPDGLSRPHPSSPDPSTPNASVVRHRRSEFGKLLLRGSAMVAFLLLVTSPGNAANDNEVVERIPGQRPNIVWLVSEDNSIHYLRHFFPGGTATPHIESLAKSGVTFNHAFSNAPVCSVARTTLATMSYAPKIGTQFHRKYRSVPLPGELRMFPAYLRDAGYYTTNRQKKDYNAKEGKGVWDESSGKATWRNRPAETQPFFHMQSFGQSHESSLHFSRPTIRNKKTQTDPNSVQLADYFPDTRTFRYTHARYHDRMRVIDEEIGKIVEQLKADDLLDKTFIFYFGDHGGVLPRSKGYLYESGLHVPLVIHIPADFAESSPFSAGERADGFVEFVDFGATVLQLAGVELPASIDGRPFMGAGISKASVESRDESFGYADRFDEKYDLVRSLRKGKFHYIRSFQPWLPDGLQNIYRYKMLAYQEWEQLFRDSNLNKKQSQFFKAKPVEMLFDVESDPHETVNLADNPAYRKTLLALRGRLIHRMTEMPDLSLFPESFLVEHALENPTAFGKKNKPLIERCLAISGLALLPFQEAKPKLVAALRSNQFLNRYWGCMVCSSFGTRADSLSTHVLPLLGDEEPTVRMRAAEFLGIIGNLNPQEPLTKIVNSTEDPVVATEALNSIVWFKDFFGDRYPVNRSDFAPRATGADVMDRLNYINGVPYPGKPGKGRNKKRTKAARQE